MSQSLLDDEAMPWPESAPAPYGHLIAYDGPPEPRGLVADVVVDGAGLYLAASTSSLDVRVRLAKTVVPGLPIVPMGVSLRHGLIDASLWHAIVERARAAIPHEVLLAIVARDPAAASEVFVASAGPYTLVEPQFDETGTGDWQPQRASAGAVRATPIPDAVMEVHSHHTITPTSQRPTTAMKQLAVCTASSDAWTPRLLRLPCASRPGANRMRSDPFPSARCSPLTWAPSATFTSPATARTWTAPPVVGRAYLRQSGRAPSAVHQCYSICYWGWPKT
jgi:hypothetical protein